MELQSKDEMVRMLHEKEKYLKELYAMYEKRQEEFRGDLPCETDIDVCLGLGDLLKIETWYYMERKYARLHIQFDQFLEYLVEVEKRPSDIWNDMRNQPGWRSEFLDELDLPLLYSGVHRKINQKKELKLLETAQCYAEKIFEGIYPATWDAVRPNLSSHIRSSIEDPRLSNHYEFLSSIEECLRHVLRSGNKFEEIASFYRDECIYTKNRWEIDEYDGLIYYGAFMELLKEEKGQKIIKLELSGNISFEGEIFALASACVDSMNVEESGKGRFKRKLDQSLEQVEETGWMNSVKDVLEGEICRLEGCLGIWTSELQKLEPKLDHYNTLVFKAIRIAKTISEASDEEQDKMRSSLKEWAVDFRPLEDFLKKLPRSYKSSSQTALNAMCYVKMFKKECTAAGVECL